MFSLLNYVGHKSNLINQILPRLPPTLDGYFYDLFSGSCVVGLSTNFKNVCFIDNIAYLQNLYSYLTDPKFLETLEDMIINHNLTNSSRKRRIDYIKEGDVGTVTINGKTVRNIHLDQLNKVGYSKIIEGINSGQWKGLSLACAYFIAVLYGRNSQVSLNIDGTLRDLIGPLDFSKRAKKKLQEHIVAINGRNLHWVTSSYDIITPTVKDFVYMDPPYLISGYKYGSNWNKNSEIKLLNWIDQLPCKWMLSNITRTEKKTNDILLKWARKYNTTLVKKKYRRWSGKGKSTAKKKAKAIQEVLITNY